jgi:hypothetical protein
MVKFHSILARHVDDFGTPRNKKTVLCATVPRREVKFGYKRVPIALGIKNVAVLRIGTRPREADKG